MWLGNDDNSPTRKTTGGGLPVEVWTRFMRVAHQNVPVVDLPIDRGGGLFGFERMPMANAQSPNAQPVQQAPNAPIRRARRVIRTRPIRPRNPSATSGQARGQSNVGGGRPLEPMGGIDSFVRGFLAGALNASTRRRSGEDPPPLALSQFLAAFACGHRPNTTRQKRIE